MGKGLDQFSAAYTQFILKWRWVIIIASLLAVGFVSSGAGQLTFATNYRVFFSDENPELIAFEELQAVYTKNDNVLFVVQPKNGKIFSPSAMKAIEEITEASWQIPYSIRVDSITNFQNTWANGDDLTVADLVKDGANMDQSTLNQREAIALAEPLLNGSLISPDADTTGINVILQLPQKSTQEVPEAAAFARQIAADIQVKYPDVTVSLSGIAMMNNAFVESGMQDAMTLIPIMYLVMIVIMLLALRSISGTIATLMVIALSATTAMGIAGFMGIPLTPISLTAPTIILTLAIADSIHVLVTMLNEMRTGSSKQEALAESLRLNIQPVFITSLTTIVGFLSLNFSDSPPFWHLGNITAMGIAAAWIFSMTFLPALVSLLPIRVKVSDSNTGFQGAMVKLSHFVNRRANALFYVMGGLAVVLALLVPSIELNDEFVKYFDTRVTFRNDTDVMTQNLTGIYNIEYSIPAKAAGGVSEPEFLQNLSAFTDWARAQPEVRHVYSLSDIMKRLNKNLHGDDPAYYKLPDSRELSAQYLFLFELSLPYGLDLNDRINIDKSATRLTMILDDMSTVEIRDFVTRSEQWLQENTPEYMHTMATSSTVMFSHISERNITSMLQGNVIAVIAIAIIMILALRHFGVGMLSIIPNSVPILMTFGIWALVIGQVGMAAATITATSLGIVVDDTVHFLTKYLRARREKNATPEEAVTYAFENVGMAICVTTAILICGFGLLSYSTFLVNSQMGLLTALAITLAVIVDFLFLPPLLIKYEKRKERSSHVAPKTVQTA